MKVTYELTSLKNIANEFADLYGDKNADLYGDKNSTSQFWRINAVFPPQKRTIIVRHFGFLDTETGTSTCLLNLPEVIFTLLVKNSNHKQLIRTLLFYGINHKKQIFDLVLPNTTFGEVCLGLKEEIAGNSFSNFFKNPSLENAENIIKPYVDYFWTSNFTTSLNYSTFRDNFLRQKILINSTYSREMQR